MLKRSAGIAAISAAGIAGSSRARAAEAAGPAASKGRIRPDDRNISQLATVELMAVWKYPAAMVSW